MSELREKLWAVISFRGVEATELSYDTAMDLRNTLDAEKINGLCIVTAEAAQREAEQTTLRKTHRQKN